MIDSSNFVITDQDFGLIENGIELAYQKMEHIFTKGLSDVDIASYDSKFFYIWSRESFRNLEKVKNSVADFKLYHLPHKIKIPPKAYTASYFTVMGLNLDNRIYKNLPSKINIQMAPNSVRLKIRQQENEGSIRKWTHYMEKHYVAILAHEFGHFYYAKNFSYPYLEQLLNLSEVLLSKDLQTNAVSQSQLHLLLNPLDYRALAELYASLVELEATKIHAPDILDGVIRNMKKYAGQEFEEGRKHPLPTRLADSSVFYAKILAPYIFQNIPNWPELFFKCAFLKGSGVAS